MLRPSFRTGISFGLTSGIITTLGLMTGLHAGTHSKRAVIGGILTIAIADAFSDALGIHISEESENRHIAMEIWEATLSTFFAKLVFALTFVIPVVLFKLSTAIVVSAIWGLSMLGIFSFSIAQRQNVKPWKSVGEHVFIALVVIFITHLIGDWISSTFC